MQYESGTFSVETRMCSTNQARLQYKRGCPVRMRHIFSTSEDVQYKSGTFSVEVRMCRTNQGHLWYKQGCAVRIRHIFSRSEDMRYESGTFSVQARMCSTNQAHLQYKRGCAVRSQAHLQYKRGCAVRIGHTFSRSEDVQYELGTSSVQARMCSTNQAHLQYKLALKMCLIRTVHPRLYCTVYTLEHTTSSQLQIFYSEVSELWLKSGLATSFIALEPIKTRM